METIKLGFKVKDNVSGFIGIATEKCEYLNGCIQYRLSPSINSEKPTEIPEGYWVDAQQLQYVDDGVKTAIKPKRTGGSTRNAPVLINGKF